MKILLSFMYIALAALQALLLIFSIKKPAKKRWRLLYLIELISIAAAIALSLLFNAMPGHGPMPGLTHFAEVFYSLFAAGAYFLLLLASLSPPCLRTFSFVPRGNHDPNAIAQLAQALYF